MLPGFKASVVFVLHLVFLFVRLFITLLFFSLVSYFWPYSFLQTSSFNFGSTDFFKALFYFSFSLFDSVSVSRFTIRAVFTLHFFHLNPLSLFSV